MLFRSHKGQDTESYTDCFSWADEKEEFLYFTRKPNQLIKYDMKGKFCGKVEFPSSMLASYYLIKDSEIIGYFDEFILSNLSDNQHQYSLGIFEKDGRLKDTVHSFYPYTSPFTGDIFQANLLSGISLYSSFGSWIRSGTFIFEYTKERQIRHISPFHAARIWKDNENIRFIQDFVDTIYTVSGSKLIPSIAFHTGKYHWPTEERRSEKNNHNRIFVADINENNNVIFFQCIKGMYSKYPQHALYNCLYNKKSNKTIISNNSENIEDDINHFIPFKPLGMSTSGEFISFVEAWEAMEWMGKHPDAENNKNLSFLKNLDSEMNPIIILIE